jgi:hypothetical protein
MIPKTRRLRQTVLSVIKQANSHVVNKPLCPDTVVSQIVNCEPKGASGAYKFKWDYLKEEVLTKLPREGVTSELRASRAIQKMLDADVICGEINRLGFKTSSSIDLERIITRAADWIWYILGELPSDILYNSGFSSGATVKYRRAEGDPYFKYKGDKGLGVTPKAYAKAYALITATPLWCSTGAWDKLKLCDGNVVFTVPKSTDVDRAACKEPCLNMALQRSVGAFIRKRLKSHAGVDLNDQSVNQVLAKVGSQDGSLATIDLKSASDSISRLLVYKLLPHPWVELLEDLRSPLGTYADPVTGDNRQLIWEKHSTMGNGYTFELESLLFWALTKASTEYVDDSYPRLARPIQDAQLVSVYGDDIICQTRAAVTVIECLRCVGFQTNTKKTFIEGPFRESCGKHYYEGYDVTPFYIRKPIDSLARVVWLLNALRRWSESDGSGICDPSVEALWLQLRRSFVPSELLGGSQLQSLTAVASPHEARWKFGVSYPKLTIDGMPALLRYFQYNNEITPINHVRWYDMDLIDPIPHLGTDPNWHQIVQSASIPKWRVKRNTEVELKPIPLFPMELGV